MQYECKARAIAPTPKLPNASCLMSVQSLSRTPSFPCKPPPLSRFRVEPSPPICHSRAGGNPCLGLNAAVDSRLRGNDGNLQQARHGNDGNKRKVRSGGLGCQAATQAGAERKRRKIYAKVAKNTKPIPLYGGVRRRRGGWLQGVVGRWGGWQRWGKPTTHLPPPAGLRWR